MIKYRSEYDTSVLPGQDYSKSHLVPEWKQDPKTLRLVQVGEIDLQKKIDSSKTCALDYILDQYLPEERRAMLDNASVQVVSDQVVVAPDTDFDSVIDEVNTIRTKYNLPEDWTYDQVFDYVNKLSSQNKEVLDNAKKTIEDSKQKELSKNSNESS